MSHFVFVESNTTGTGCVAVERLLADRHCVTFLTRTPAKYAFLANESPLLEVVEIDTNDVESVTRAVGARQARLTVDAILTFSDFYVAIVAEAAARLGLRYLNPETARTCREKPRTRLALGLAGMPTPESWVLSSEADAHRVAGTAAYPCVVKPPSDSSSTGVRLVANPFELVAHYRQLSACAVNVRGQRLTGEVLVESLLDGPEFSVETVTLEKGRTRVIGVTAKHLSPPPHFVETGHDFPAPLPGAVARELGATAVAGLDAVGYDFGPAHTEIRWTSRGPVIVEINARLAGGMIPVLVAHATGIDLLGACLDLAAGRAVALEPWRDDVASIRFLTASAAGTLTGIDGVRRARRLPTVREIVITREVGSAIRPAEDAYDRIGFVIAAGAPRTRVMRDVDHAVELIGFRTEAPRHAVA